jgi:N-methylhydantoinase B
MINPITAEVIRDYLETVSQEIIQSMVRAAVSPIFNEAHDCSAGIFWHNGKRVDLVARGDAVPVHIFACLTSVEACLKFFSGDLDDGDVLLACDPYFGGTHIGDYTIIKPVFCNNKPVFFPSVRAHMLDVGGPAAGFNGDAWEVWQEGFRFPPIKVFEKGELRRDVWDLLRGNNRIPDIAVADLEAMIGACKLGEQRIRTLIDRYGLDTVRDGVEYTLDYSERALRNLIATWPDGVYRGRSLTDQDYRGTTDINVDVAIEVNGTEVVVDFAGTHPQCPGIINSVVGNTMSYVYGCFAAVCPEVPINSGFFRPIRALLPEGSVVNPHSPAAAGYSTICIGCTIGEAVTQALSLIVPERAGTTSIDLTMLWAFGIDPRTHRYFISFDYQCTPISAGASYGVDGWGGWAALFCALTLPSAEIHELQYPFLYLQSADFVTDSAAPGQWRGAPSCVMKRMTYGSEGPLKLTIWVQGERHTLQGYVGGRPGVGNYALVHCDTADERRVDAYTAEASPPGDLVLFKSGGGGGWGDPLDRDPQAVVDDVRNEYVSIEGAERDYGVVITNGVGFAVDTAATERVRAQRRAGATV